MVKKQPRNPQNYILGIDVGVGSLGVALIAIDGDTPRILNGSSLIYPSASGNSDRRTHRLARNYFQNRTKRKKLLQKKLTEFLQLQGEGYRIGQTHIKPYNAERFPKVKNKKNNSCVALRAMALDEQLTLPELFRVFMHLATHRGVRLTKAIKEAEQKETGVLKQAIQELQEQMQTADNTGKMIRTVGEYLAKQEKKGQAIKLRPDAFNKRAIFLLTCDDYQRV